MISELVEFNDHLPIHAPSSKNVGLGEMYWEKSKSHIGQINFLIKVYKEESNLTLQAEVRSQISTT